MAAGLQSSLAILSRRCAGGTENFFVVEIRRGTFEWQENAPAPRKAIDVALNRMYLAVRYFLDWA